MCSRRRVAWLLGAMLAAVPAAAQIPTPLRQRVDALERALERNSATLARADSSRRVSVPLDTLHAGSLTVITTRGTTASVRAVIDHAWRILNGTYGDGATLLSRYPLLVQIADQAGELLPLYAAADARLRGVSRTAILPTGSDTGTVLRALLFQSSLVLGAFRDSALTAWLRVNFTPPWPRDDRLEQAYVDLVTSPWSHARACYVGDLDSCRSALGLVRGPEAVMLWYDAPDRRRLVRALSYSSVDRSAQTPYQRCLNGGPDEACVAAVRGALGYNLGFIPETPLASPARLSIMQAALTAGGRTAYARLLASAGRSMDERLAWAAGIPADSLLSRWRAAVLTARPKTVAFGTKQAWAALLWGVVFGFLALKSTRWR